MGEEVRLTIPRRTLPSTAVLLYRRRRDCLNIPKRPQFHQNALFSCASTPAPEAPNAHRQVQIHPVTFVATIAGRSTVTTVAQRSQAIRRTLIQPRLDFRPYKRFWTVLFGCKRTQACKVGACQGPTDRRRWRNLSPDAYLDVAGTNGALRPGNGTEKRR